MSYITDPSKWKDITPDMYDEINAEIEQTFAKGCHGNCESCESGCEDKNHLPIFAKRMYIVTSGKGGTGKSTVAVMLAAELARQGLKVGLLDCDLSCSTAAHMLGVTELVSSAGDDKMNPVVTKEGIRLMSFNLIESDHTAPVLWPAGDQYNVIRYMYTGALWGELDVMIVDMPAGGGDVPLNLYTEFPLSGTIIVTNPGELAVGPVQRCISLCRTLMAAPVAMIENKGFDTTPSCQQLYQLPPLCQTVALPLDAEITAACDDGTLTQVDCAPLAPVVEYIKARVKNAGPVTGAAN
jgi:Mrp family chromosome partitioning ATPase